MTAITKAPFGVTKNGTPVEVYTMENETLRVKILTLGGTIAAIEAPDKAGNMADICLGFDNVKTYEEHTCFFGALIGRYANRIGGAAFTLNGKRYQLAKNDNGNNNLHSGPDFFKNRIWEVLRAEEDSIVFGLISPHGDQGFPGNAKIRVKYTLEQGNTLRITYKAISDRDTVFNFTNHSYFNLAGHDKPEKAMEQVLTMPARFYTRSDDEYITTGEKVDVEGTAMDFRTPKPIGRDIDKDEEPMRLQNGYDHNFEVFTYPCAILSDPESGRTMSVTTDCPGVQLYSGNFMEREQGKDGVVYGRRAGVCLETQFFPNAVNYPHWVQPIAKAGEEFRSETCFTFGWNGQ